MAKINPEQERQRLVRRYSAMSDLELQKAGRDPAAVTEIAFAVLPQEMDRRQLDWPGKGTSWRLLHPAVTVESRNSVQSEFAAIPDPTFTSGPNDDHGAPEIVRKYQNMPEALAAKMTLESAGIECSLFDETFIRMDWFCSNALGGVKLVVRKNDADEARTILNEKTPDKFAGEGIEEYQQPRCPACGSLDASWKELNKMIAYPVLLFPGLPIPVKEKAWHCHACDHRWGANEDDGHQMK